MKSQKYKDWEEQSAMILKPQIVGRLTGRVDVVIKVEDTHPTRDADNLLKPAMDLLVTCGALLDDRSRFVRSVKAEWAPIKGLRIEIERVAA